MPNSQWLDAAARYRKAAEQNGIEGTLPPRRTAPALHNRLEQEIASAARGLAAFLRDEGEAIKVLLRASQRIIVFGENKDSNGYGEAYILHEEGLRQTNTIQLWTLQTRLPSRSQLFPISERDAVRAAVVYARRPATQVVSWLQEELNKIAKAAP